MKVANTMAIRLQNALNIINDLECNSGITNMELAHNRGLSAPTISNIVNILKNNNIVMTTGTGESSGGRKPVCISLNKNYQYFIGVSIARHTVYILLIDFEGHIYDKERQYIQFEDTDEYWHEILDLINKMKAKINIPCKVGIALPGFVYDGQKHASDTYTLGKPSVDFDNIYRIVGTSVSIDDSCRLAAMAQVFGKKDVEDNFFILLSRRVSGILIYNRSIFKMKVSSIDIGAMLMPSGSAAASMETESFYELCSASKIIDDLKARCEITGYEQFFEEIHNGNEEFSKLWDSYLRNLSVAIYNIYSIFKVTIVIGGEMAKYIAPYTGKLNDYVTALVSRELHQNICLKCSIYGEYDDAYGAALEARSHFLQNSLPKLLKNPT